MYKLLYVIIFITSSINISLAEPSQEYYVSLSSNKVNMRVGPGIRYPIKWVYKKKGLPMLLLNKFDHWRYVRDVDGAEGWIHKSLLRKVNKSIVINKGILYSDPDKSNAIVIIEPVTLVNLHECDSDFCQIGIGKFLGWFSKNGLWANEIR